MNSTASVRLEAASEWAAPTKLCDHLVMFIGRDGSHVWLFWMHSVLSRKPRFLSRYVAMGGCFASGAHTSREMNDEIAH